jgi:phage repressor protein C with HTH and peptisase S24 domain
MTCDAAPAKLPPTMSMRFIPKRLADLGLNQNDLAQALGIDASGVSRMLKGERHIRANEVAVIAQLLRITVDDLVRELQSVEKSVENEETRILEAVRSPVAVRTNTARPIQTSGEGPIAVMGRPVLGGGGSFEMTPRSVDAVPRPRVLDGVPGAYAVFMPDDSMEPRYFTGELLFIHPGKPFKIGSFVVVTVKGQDDEPPRSYIRMFIGVDRADAYRFAQLKPQGAPPLIVPSERIVNIHRIVMAQEQ